MDAKPKSKLKNKKKDVISLNDTSTPSPSPSTSSSSKDNNGPQQPPIDDLPEQFYLEMNKNTTHLIDKVLWEIQVLLAMTNSIDDKLKNCFVPLLSKEHINNILEERESRNVCGNFQCGKVIDTKSKSVYSYNSIKKQYTKIDPQDYFCSIECFNIFKQMTLTCIDKFDYFKLLSLNTIFLLANIKYYYPEQKNLNRIADLSENLIQDYLTHNKEAKSKLGNYFQRRRLRIAKMFIDDFDEVIKDNEFNSNEETKEIFHELFGLIYNN
jgi:hypothetical protein